MERIERMEMEMEMELDKPISKEHIEAREARKESKPNSKREAFEKLAQAIEIVLPRVLSKANKTSVKSFDSFLHSDDDTTPQYKAGDPLIVMEQWMNHVRQHLEIDQPPHQLNEQQLGGVGGDPGQTEQLSGGPQQQQQLDINIFSSSSTSTRKQTPTPSSKKRLVKNATDIDEQSLGTRARNAAPNQTQLRLYEEGVRKLKERNFVPDEVEEVSLHTRAKVAKPSETQLRLFANRKKKNGK